jgi:hypothetical protein
MSLSAPPWLSAFFVALALGTFPAARAQALYGDGENEPDPLAAKERAQHQRRRQAEDPKELARGMRQAARAAYDIRLELVKEGLSLDIDTLLEESLQLFNAESLVADGPSGRIAALRGHLERVREVEGITKYRAAVRPFPYTTADFRAARGERLMAEWRLARALAEEGNAARGALPAVPDGPGPLEAGESARTRFEVTRAKPASLARDALDATLEEEQGLAEGVRTGYRFDPDRADLSLRRRVELARASGDGRSGLLAALEGYWLLCRRLEGAYRYAANHGVDYSYPIDFAIRARRVEAGARIAEARARPGDLLPLQGGLQDPFGAVGDDPLGMKDVAQEKCQAVQGDPRRRAEEWREAVLSNWAIFARLLQSGEMLAPDRGDHFSQRLLDAGLALSESRADRLAALEGHCERTRKVEGYARTRRRLRTADYWSARYVRLQAELRLAEARARKD